MVCAQFLLCERNMNKDIANRINHPWGVDYPLTTNVFMFITRGGVATMCVYCTLSHDQTLSANQRSLNVRYISCITRLFHKA